MLCKAQLKMTANYKGVMCDDKSSGSHTTLCNIFALMYFKACFQTPTLWLQLTIDIYIQYHVQFGLQANIVDARHCILSKTTREF